VVILCPNGADCTDETVGAWWWRRLRPLVPSGLRPRRAEPADPAPITTSGPRDRSKAAGDDHGPPPPAT
jgi:hypothetical protein